MITQFIAAFDDIVINRYNKSRDVVDKIQVRYLYAPKERVVYDIVNKAQNMTIPAVAVSITSVERDESRVFNKIVGHYDVLQSQRSTMFTPSPVPVNLSVSMSIITKFQTDMDQILSNFITYTNPYIIISWKTPDMFTNETIELRSEVSWSGAVSLQYPIELQASGKARVTADTTFTIKGWLWPTVAPASLSANNIYTITSNFTPLTGFNYI
mgnify:CR=1 FL=1